MFINFNMTLNEVISHTFGIIVHLGISEATFGMVVLIAIVLVNFESLGMIHPYGLQVLSQ